MASKMKVIVRCVAVAAICFVVYCFVFISQGAKADSVSSVKEKFLHRGMLVCYSRYFVDSFEYDTLKTTLTARKDLLKQTATDNKFIVNPPDSRMTCDQLLKDNNVAIGGGWSNDEKGSFLESLGYEKKVSNSKETKVEFVFQGYDASSARETNEERKIILINKSDETIEMVGENGSVDNVADNTGNSVRILDMGNGNIETWWGITDKIGDTCTGNFSQLTSCIDNNLKKVKAVTRSACADGDFCLSGLKYSKMNNLGSSATTEKYEKPANTYAGFKKAYETIFKDTFSDAVVDISLDEAVALYSDYLYGYYGAVKDFCGQTEDEAKAKADATNADFNVWKITKDYSDGGKMQYCYVMRNDSQDKRVYGVERNGDSWMASIAGNGDEYTIGYDDVRQWLYDNGPESIDAELAASAASGEVYGSNDDSGDDSDNDAGEEDLCNNSAGATGWAVCTIIQAVGNALNSAYDEFIEPLLQVRPEVVEALKVDTNNPSAIYQAWSVFRDMANVVFIIFFLVIIFSQVTGYGIDNYGIKRMLPRLIIGAILINFSFLICQLAVDISNIMGSTLQDLMMNIGKDIKVGGEAVSGVSKLLGTILGLLGVGGAVAIGANAFFSGAITMSAILSIGLTIITALGAIFFGMVLLGARQAIIILLVATSPVAFVLYLLPNTQMYFKKWTSIFSRLLMVYPAAGLLIGGGYLAAKIILSVPGAGFIMSLIGLIMLVVPFFLIIPLVRASMNAIAGLGGKIQAVGRGANKLTHERANKIAGSDTFKRLDAQMRAANLDKKVKWAKKKGGLASGTIGRLGAPGKAVAGALTDSSMMDLARRAEAADKQEQADIAAGAIMDARVDPRDDDETLRTRFLNAQSDRERSVIAQRWEKANRKGFVDSMANMAVANELDAGWAKTYFQNNRDASNMLDKRNPWAFNYVATGGAGGSLLVEKDGKYAINDAYKKGLQLNDMTGLATDAINLGVATNEIDSKLAYDTMTSTAPNIQSTIQSDPDKAPILQSVADAHVPGKNVSGTNVAVAAAAQQAARAKVNNRVTQVQNAKKMTNLSFANGENVSSSSSAALVGIPPSNSINVNVAYKEKNGGHRLVLVDEARNIGWDATNGKELSGADLQAAISNSGSPISRMTGTGNGNSGSSNT